MVLALRIRSDTYRAFLAPTSPSCRPGPSRLASGLRASLPVGLSFLPLLYGARATVSVAGIGSLAGTGSGRPTVRRGSGRRCGQGALGLRCGPSGGRPWAGVRPGFCVPTPRGAWLFGAARSDSSCGKRSMQNRQAPHCNLRRWWRWG